MVTAVQPLLNAEEAIVWEVGVTIGVTVPLIIVLEVTGVKVTVVGGAKDVVTFDMPLAVPVELRPGRAAIASASC